MRSATECSVGRISTWTISHTEAVRSQSEIEGEYEVVLQVLSNRKVDLSVNTILIEDRRLSDTRELEELWSLVRPYAPF